MEGRKSAELIALLKCLDIAERQAFVDYLEGLQVVRQRAATCPLRAPASEGDATPLPSARHLTGS